MKNNTITHKLNLSPKIVGHFNFSITLIILCSQVSIFAQSPGGVSTDLAIWSKANAGTNTTTDGATVSSWANQVGGTLVPTTFITHTLPSTFTEQGLNFNPGIKMVAGAGMGQDGAYSASVTNSGAELTHIYVGKLSAGEPIKIGWNVQMAATDASVNAFSTAINSTGAYINSTTSAGFFNYPGDINNTNHFNPSNPILFGLAYTQGNNLQEYRANGFSIPTNYNVLYTNRGNNFLLHADLDVNGDKGGWDYNEVISYERRLTPNEIQRVESYLAIKYGLTLPYNYLAADGTTIYDAASFGVNITGIGRDDMQDLYQKQSKSTNGSALVTIGIENTIATTNIGHTGSFDANNEFIIFGSNNELTTFSAPSFSGPCYVPESVDALSDQRWKLQETGAVASTRIELPLTYFSSSVITANPIYLVYADDAALNTNSVSVQGTVDGSIVYFNVDFPTNSTVYYGFAGSITVSPCLSCTGGNQYFSPGEAFGYSCAGTAQSTNSVTGVTTTEGNADITADLSVTFPAGVNEYVPPCWPRRYGKWLQLIRYDGEVGASGDVIYRTGLNQSAKPSFDIGGIDNFIGQADEIEIIGYCGGAPVPNAFTTSLKYPSSNTYGATYGTVDPTASGGDARTNYNFYASPYWKYGTLHVEFTQAVDEIEVRWRQKSRTYSFDYYQYLYIGPMTLSCPFVPACSQADEIYANIQFDQTSYSTCDTATMYLKLINRGCGIQTIDLQNSLPANANYIAGSLNPDILIVAGGSIGTINGYGNTTTLAIQDIAIPLGEFTLPIQVTGTGAITGTLVQATFQVNGGATGLSNCGSSGTPLAFVVETPPYIPEISLSASEDCYDTGEKVTYTLTFNNTSGSAANPINLSTLLGAAFTVDNGTVVYSAPSMTSDGNFISNESAGIGILDLQNLMIASGTSTIQVTTSANSSADDANVWVEIVGDVANNCAVATAKSDSLTVVFYCVDKDGDGIANTDEIGTEYDSCEPVQFPGYTGYDATNKNWAAADCDGDGILNGEEHTNGTDPYLNDCATDIIKPVLIKN
ncbi:MAG: thrombospondin type 3 repeat-containing protein [Saprospiraceae bacterium]